MVLLITGCGTNPGVEMTTATVVMIATSIVDEESTATATSPQLPTIEGTSTSEVQATTVSMRSETPVASATTSPPLTPTSTPTPTVDPWQTVELKQEMYLSTGYGGGGGPNCEDIIPARADVLPVLRAYQSRDHRNAALFCLFGFPTEEHIQIEVYSPQGELAGNERFDPSEQSLNLSQEHGSLVTFSFDIWFPAGTQRGEWKILARINDVEVGTTFVVTAPDWPRVDTRPSPNVDMFSIDDCAEYEIGDQVYISGEGLESEATLPLGIYRIAAREVRLASGVYIIPAQLTAARYVQTDQLGDFETGYQIRPRDDAGYYYVSIILDPSVDDLGSAGPSGCFSIRSNTEPSSNCENDAQFVADVNFPDYTEVVPGETFTKTWRLRNSGTCPWSNDYWFVHVEDDLLGAPPYVSLPDEVEPGEEVNLSVPFVAPEEPGDYVSRWRFQASNGEVFGERAYVLITVIDK